MNFISAQGVYITLILGEDYYRKTQTKIVRENLVKCFEVFCTII